MYGTPNVYGVVSMPFTVRDGINIFLSGYIPTDNVRFREFGLEFEQRNGNNYEDYYQQKIYMNLTEEEK